MLRHISPYLQYVIAINTPPCFSISPISDRHKRSAVFLHISKMFCQLSSSTHFVLCSMEKTQSPISPYMCYGLRALRYGWSATVPWSRLFLLHMHGLRARRYGLWASQGQEPSKELTARTLLIPHIIALGLTLHIFFTKSVSKTHKHAYNVYLQHLYKYINVCLCPRASNSPLQMLRTGFPPLRLLCLALTVYLTE